MCTATNSAIQAAQVREEKQTLLTKPRRVGCEGHSGHEQSRAPRAGRRRGKPGPAPADGRSGAARPRKRLRGRRQPSVRIRVRNPADGLRGGRNVLGRASRGRQAEFRTRVHGNGNLLIGKAYTALLDLKAGDEFEIKLGKKQIRLLPTEES